MTTNWSPTGPKWGSGNGPKMDQFGVFGLFEMGEIKVTLSMFQNPCRMEQNGGPKQRQNTTRDMTGDGMDRRMDEPGIHGYGASANPGTSNQFRGPGPDPTPEVVQDGYPNTQNGWFDTPNPRSNLVLNTYPKSGKNTVLGGFGGVK